MKNNVILIGMPGSGKSTAGILSAKALCKSFVDTDLLIQEEEGMPLQRIIDEKGIDYFLACEERAVSSLDFHNTVVATGGSVVYSARAMAHLRSLGTVIYLRLDEETMMRRIRNITTRGVVMRNGATMSGMFAERSPLYEKFAEVVIDCGEKTVEDTVKDIVTAVR